MALTFDFASNLVQAVIKSGREQGMPLAVAVVDTGGRLVAAGREAQLGFINLDVAQKKAVTAVNFGAPTRAVLDMIKGEAFLLDAVMQESQLSVIPGGLPIMLEGKLVGALGIAGGRYDHDHAIGEKTLATLVRAS